jgi:predicted MPP superfamily phosphohydrolase
MGMTTISLRALMTAPRIIHISDLHFIDPNSPGTMTLGGFRKNDSVLRSELIASFLIGNRPILAGPGGATVVITGDLTDSGDDADYQFAQTLIGRLRACRFNVYVTPGNHDYCREGVLALGTKVDHIQRRQRFNKYILLNYAGNYSTENYTNPVAGVGDTEYPRYADIEGGRLILLDSMQGELDQEREGDGDNKGQGKLGKYQLQALGNAINDYQSQRQIGKKLVVCLHHAPLEVYNAKPGWDGLLDDYASLLGCISGTGGKSKIDCLLFGHTGDTQDRYGSEEQKHSIALINSENLEDVDESKGQPYAITVLDLGTYRRLVFQTNDANAMHPAPTWGNPTA